MIYEPKFVILKLQVLLVSLRTMDCPIFDSIYLTAY